MNREIVSLVPFLYSQNQNSATALSGEQRFLLDLLRRALQKAGMAPLLTDAKRKVQDPEGLFYKIVLNDFNQREARLFAAHLLLQQSFYQRIRPLVELIVQAQNEQHEFSGSMLPDEAFWRRIAAIQAPNQAFPTAIWHRLAARIKSVCFSPRWAIASAFGILLICFAYGMLKTNEFYREFFVRPAEPFASFSPETFAFRSTFRGPSLQTAQWQETYRMAVAAYLNKEYGKAVGLFRTIEPVAQSEGLSETWRREFFFHYGMACLGMSRGKSLNRKDYAEAIRLFQRALSCHPAQRDADEIRFFLGLALYLQGKKTAAAAHFKEISAESAFYPQGQKIISN